MARLIVERLTGQTVETYQNAAMQFGIDTEPQARAAYEFATDRSVIEEGWVPHPEIPDSGCSPDGLVADGLVEIKSPNTATHIDTLLSGKPEGKYVLQMQWQMACTGRAWCDFVSFDPRMPPHLQLFVKTVPRDDAVIASITAEMHKFLAEMADKIEQLNALGGPQ